MTETKAPYIVRTQPMPDIVVLPPLTYAFNGAVTELGIDGDREDFWLWCQSLVEHLFTLRVWAELYEQYEEDIRRCEDYRDERDTRADVRAASYPF